MNKIKNGVMVDEIKGLGYKIAPNGMIILHNKGEIVCEIKDSPSAELFTRLTLICQCVNGHDALLSACEFYADEQNYTLLVSGRTNVLTDGGKMAKAAIAAAKE